MEYALGKRLSCIYIQVFDFFCYFFVMYLHIKARNLWIGVLMNVDRGDLDESINILLEEYSCCKD